MSDRFDQLDRAVHRMNFPPIYLDATRPPTVGAVDFGSLLGGHIASSAGLDHAAESLSDFVGGDFDLIVVRRGGPLLDGLDLTGDIRCLFEDFDEFFLESCLFRVHAILPEH